MRRSAAVAVVLAVTGCGGSDVQSGQAVEDVATPTVYAVNYPLAYFAERIGGEHVTVEFPAPRDLDPAFWRPDEETIGAYQSADLVLLNGAGYAKWLDVVTLSASRLVNTSASFSDRYLAVAGTVTHSTPPCRRGRGRGS